MGDNENKLELPEQVAATATHFYEVRLMALSQYSDRAWNRFNWLLTLQLAVFWLYFTQFEKLLSVPFLRIGIPCAGLIVAARWGVIGGEDYVSMRKYGKRVSEIEDNLFSYFAQYGFVFSDSLKKSLLGFRQTWLLFVFPSIVFLCWALILCSFGAVEKP